MGDKLRRWLALAATLLAAGCSASSGDGDPGGGGPITIALGSGEQAFTPLADGGPINVYQGPQGGYHVFLSVRVTGLDPGDASRPPSACASAEANDNPCVELEVRDPAVPDGPIDFYVALHLPLTAGPAGSFDLDPPRLVQLDIGGLVDIEGHTLEIHAVVTDRAGRVADTTLVLTAVGVPLDGP